MPERNQRYAELIAESMSKYLNNHRRVSFELLEVSKYATTTPGKATDSHDASSLLRSCHALLNLFEGLLSGSVNVMLKCIEEFWEAEKLANDSRDKEWIGNRLSRALSYLFGGMLQVFTHSYVKAGVNLTVGFKLCRDLEKDILEYSGPNPEIIRSFGFMLLGLWNMLSVILPSSISTIGDYLGFGVSKEKYYQYTETCNHENGQFAMVSNLIFVYFVINSKNFLFEKATSAELAKCRVLIDSCILKGPHSLVVQVLHASVCLGEGSPKNAISTLNAALSFPSTVANLDRPEWATMGLATYFKLGNSHLCNLDFAAARLAFLQASKCLERSSSWPYIPYMRTLEGLCYLASSPVEYKEIALTIFSDTFIDRDLAKQPVILPGDKWASRVGYEQTQMLLAPPLETNPVVEILFAMLTCLYTFEKVDVGKLGPFISGLKKTIDRKKKSILVAKFQTVLGEFYRLAREWDKAVAAFDDAVATMDTLIKEGSTDDPDNILGFALVYQGAALVSSGELETAGEVLVDLNQVISHTRYGGIFKSVFAAPKIMTPKPGNIVDLKGGELELILNFRRNGLKKRIDALTLDQSNASTKARLES